MLVQDLLPTREALLFPVPVSLPNIDDTIRRQFRDDEFDFCCRRIVCVDQQGDAFVGLRHNDKSADYRIIG